MPAFGVSGTTLNPQQMYALARYSGFTPREAVQVAGIGLGWSGGVTNQWQLPTGQLGLWGQPYIDPGTGNVPWDLFQQFGSAESFAGSPARQASQVFDMAKRGGIESLRTAGLSAWQESIGVAQARLAALETPDSEVPDIVGGIQAGLNQPTPPQVGAMVTGNASSGPVADTNNWSLGLTPSQRPATTLAIPSAAFQVSQGAPVEAAHGIGVVGVVALVALASGFGFFMWRMHGRGARV